ncbi:MAG: SRPBCC family protein [Actinomycetota bacterium]|nr:SRPBCC family protein [Actinomycetota bacterium]
MKRITASTTVRVEPQTAFEYVADITKHAEWANPKSGLLIEHVGGTGAGATYKSSQKFLGRDAGAAITVTTFEPGQRFAFDAVEHGKRFGHSFTFAPADGGTTITRDIDAPLPPVVSLFAAPAIRKEAQAGLEMLREKLEAK